MSGARRRRRRGEVEHEEEVNHERWAVSYMDMVTIMMCLFIVLYAISQVDSEKFAELRRSLAVGFGATSTSVQVTEGGSGVLAADAIAPEAPELANFSGGVVEGPEVVADVVAARAEVAELTALEDQLLAALQAQGVAQHVSFTIDERGLIIGFVSADVFFGADSAHLTDTALQVIDALTPVLGPTSYEMVVEGHANVLPTSRYPTNWELSADRATQVLRRMVEQGQIPGGRMRAAGLGDAHPAEASGQDALTTNRRVDVVVLSDAPEAVRLHIPQVLAEQGA